MMTNFTKGKWTRRGYDIGVVDQSDTQSYGMLNIVCSMDNFDFKDDWKANAHLISAAPELYEALELMLNYCEALENRALDNRVKISDLSERFERDPEDAAECVLAKARGEL